MLTTADMTTDRQIIIQIILFYYIQRTMKSQKYNKQELMTTNKLVLTSTKITLCTKLKLKFSTTKIFHDILYSTL